MQQTPSAVKRAHISFGIDLLDRMVPIGQSLGKLHAVLGTIGSGKTTLLQMLVGEGARLEFQARSNGAWLFFSFEEGKTQIMRRLWSSVSLVSRCRIEEGCALTDCKGEIIDYEANLGQRLSDHGFAGMGEADRLAVAEQILGHTCVIDLSKCNGQLHERSAARSMVNTLRDFAISVSNTGMCVRGICIDNLKLGLWRILRLQRYGESAMHRRTLRDTLVLLEEQIAQAFGCPVWVSHHVDESEANRAPTEVHHHHNASLLPTFGDYCGTVFSLGEHDRESRCFQLACTKTTADRMPPVRLARISPYVHIIEEATDTLLDPHRHRIASRKSMSLSVIRRARPSLGPTPPCQSTSCPTN